MYLTPGLRDNHRRGVLFSKAKILVGKFVRLVAQAAGDHRAHLVEALKRLSHFACRGRFDRFPIPFDARALILIATEGRVLPSNLVQLHRPHSGMALDREQGVRSLDRAMLSRVARKYQPRIPFPDKTNQFEHLASTNLARLVHNDDRPFGQFPLEKETGDC